MNSTTEKPVGAWYRLCCFLFLGVVYQSQRQICNCMSYLLHKKWAPVAGRSTQSHSSQVATNQVDQQRGHMWLWDGIPFLLQDLSEVSQHGVISHTSSYNTSDLIPHLGWGLGCWQVAQSNFISQEETKNRRRELDFKDHQITWSGSWPIFLCMFCVMHLQDTDDCTHNKCLLFLHHTVKRKSHVGKKSEGRDGQSDWRYSMRKDKDVE